jgi:sulfatase modifying factor 1
VPVVRYASGVRGTIVLGACAIAAAATACSLFVDLNGLEDGGASCSDCGDAGPDSGVLDAATDTRPQNEAAPPESDASARDAACPSGKGPPMLSAGSYCIDSTEVTADDYLAFFAGIGGASGAVTRPPECAWKSDTSSGCSGGGGFPIACVDWCDAYAYCAWAGKRLCGNVFDGGALTYNSGGDRLASEWSADCSPDGRVFPYGASFLPGTCDTRLVDGGNAPGTVAVASLPDCVGGIPGLYDMAGNVEEWINSCDTHDGGLPSDSCHEGGDCYDYAATGPAQCDNNDNDSRNATSSDVGIRCCATP